MQVNDMESEIFDVDEYDNVLANFVEARSKLNQVRTNRGFYPVVALVDPNNMRSGSNKGKSKGKGKSKSKAKGRGSSPPQKGGAKARGKALFGGRQICVGCGAAGHQARKCPIVKEIRRERSRMEATRSTW